MILSLASGWIQDFVVQCLAFGIVLFLLGRFLIPALRKILTERAKGFQDTFDRLDRSARESAERLSEIRGRLARKEDEAKKRLAAALAEGAQMKAQALADANAQAQSALNRAARETTVERDKAILELKKQTIELTMKASEIVVNRMVTPEVHTHLVDEYLGDLDRVMS